MHRQNQPVVNRPFGIWKNAAKAFRMRAESGDKLQQQGFSPHEKPWQPQSCHGRFSAYKRPCYHGNAGCRSSDLCLRQSAVLPSQVSPMTGSRQRTGFSALTAPDRAGPFTPFPFTPEVTKASPGPHPFDSHLLYHLL